MTPMRTCVALCVLIVGVLFFSNCTVAEEGNFELCIESHAFSVKIADTHEKRKKGLMHVNRLQSHEGMLFVFPTQEKHAFWMKNTAVSLDIIWINDQHKIVHIHHQAEPYDETPIYPDISSRFVLEISGGLSQQYGFKKGQTVQLPSPLKKSS